MLPSTKSIAIAFYTSSLGKKVKDLEKRLDLEEYEAARWKHQAEKALEQLKRE
jgi:CcmD family protein